MVLVYHQHPCRCSARHNPINHFHHSNNTQAAKFSRPVFLIRQLFDGCSRKAEVRNSPQGLRFLSLLRKRALPQCIRVCSVHPRLCEIPRDSIRAAIYLSSGKGIRANQDPAVAQFAEVHLVLLDPTVQRARGNDGGLRCHLDRQHADFAITDRAALGHSLRATAGNGQFPPLDRDLYAPSQPHPSSNLGYLLPVPSGNGRVRLPTGGRLTLRLRQHLTAAGAQSPQARGQELSIVLMTS
jgi:hypothetical protein